LKTFIRNTLIIKLIILLFLISFEISLRFSGYGINTDIFSKITINGTKYYKDNTQFINKYYPQAFTITTSDEKNLFTVKKDPGTIRGFILGGSAAAGFPYNSNQSFGTIVQKALENSGTFSKVDVINVSFPLMSSYYITDAAHKLLRYKPDFLIIYTGENEYYDIVRGDIKNSHLYVKTKLFLKEIKLIQLFLNLVKKPDVSLENRYSFIDTQINDFDFTDKGENDLDVKSRFTKNINSVLQLYENKKIPVVLTEALSNIFDMPPFSSEYESEATDFITRYKRALDSRDSLALKSLFQQSQSLEMFRKNASVNFLNGVASNYLLKNSPEALNYFLIAVEQDKTPLRVKSSLFTTLSSLYITKKKEFKYINFLSLKQMILSLNDLSLLGNRLCADHTHLTQEGNRVAAYYIALNLSELLKLDVNKVLSLFSKKTEELNSLLQISDIDNFAAFLKTFDIFNSKPYQNLVIDYAIEPIIDLENSIVSNKRLYNTLKELSGKNLYLDAGYFYYENDDIQRALEIARSFVQNYPGYDGARYLLSQIYEQTGEKEKAKNEIIFAYSLSNRNSKVYELAQSILNDDELKKMIQINGKPASM